MLGMDHEQKRIDSRDHVKFNPQNLKDPEDKEQFLVKKGAYTGAPYDYQSTTHYAKTLFSADPTDETKPVLEPINCEPFCPKELG